MEFEKLLSISDDWLKYAIYINLLNEKRENLTQLREKAIKDYRIQEMLKDITDFHGTLVSNHKNPNLPIHKLLFLLDIGFDTEIPEIRDATEEICKQRDEYGIYQSLVNIPKCFGGSGEDTFSWCLCDAPLLLFALVKAGYDYNEYIKNGVDYLVAFHRDNGFPCKAAPELGKFRGPGRKDDCCPYATLIMAKLLSAIPEYENSDIANETAFALLSLWENSLEKHPYLFYMGKDFRKLKTPSLWYDIVSVTEVLSHFEVVKEDSRFKEMLTLIHNKENDEGFFTPESVYRKFKDWDFGQKKVSSPYLTYLCFRIFKRVGIYNT